MIHIDDGSVFEEGTALEPSAGTRPQGCPGILARTKRAKPIQPYCVCFMSFRTMPPASVEAWNNREYREQA